MLSTCISESVTSFSATLGEADVRKWYTSYLWSFYVVSVSEHNIFFFFSYRVQQVEGVLEEEKSLNILEDPTMVINQVSNFSQ